MQLRKLTAVAALLFAANSAFAQAISPDTTDFGALPIANFGGMGIPNDAVAQTTVNGVTLGLTATPRFSNPAVTNNGAGTFLAQAGIDAYAGAGAPYALWNFDFYVGNASGSGTGGNFANYNYKLFYDFDPAAANGQASHGTISIIGALAQAIDPLQNSYNLGMDFLATTNPAIGLVAPSGSFDPSALGEYTFKLAAYTSTGSVFAGNFNAFGNEEFSTAMLVSAVPEPGEWALMLAGLALVGQMAKRRAKTAA